MDKQFTVGSKAFFSGMPDFQSKDTDRLILTDTPKGYNHYRQSSMSGRCNFEWARKPKADFIAYAKREKAHGLEFGKFLVPEFASELGLTIAEFGDLYDFYKAKIDEAHSYQKVIAEAYIANGKFTITEEQLNKAYEAYQKAHTKEEVTEDK